LNLDAGNPASYPGSGTTWTDISGTGNNGILTNGPTYNSADGGSIVFDGNDDHVLVNSSASIPYGASARTVSIWFYTNATTWARDVNALFMYGTGNTGSAFGIDMDNYPTIQVFTWGGGGRDLTFSTTYSQVGWKNITVTYDGSTTILIYENGVLTQTLTLASACNTTSSPIYIGSANPSAFASYFDGRISQTSIYNRALTAAEVTYNYNVLRGRFPLTLVVDSLQLWIDADNSNSYPGSGTAVTDLSGNGRTQNLSNSLAYTTLSGIKCWDCSGSYFIQAATIGPTLPTTGFTYTVWARMKSSTASWRTLLHPSPNDATIVIENGSNRLGIYDDNGSGFVSAGYDVAALADTWVQWSVTGNASGQAFYINGVQVGTTATTSAGNAHWLIGGLNDGSQGFGHVAQVQLYDRVLSVAEIQQNFNVLRGRFGI
jgi:hypothetical protein